MLGKGGTGRSRWHCKFELSRLFFMNNSVSSCCQIKHDGFFLWHAWCKGVYIEVFVLYVRIPRRRDFMVGVSQCWSVKEPKIPNMASAGDPLETIVSEKLLWWAFRWNTRHSWLSYVHSICRFDSLKRGNNGCHFINMVLIIFISLAKKPIIGFYENTTGLRL